MILSGTKLPAAESWRPVLLRAKLDYVRYARVLRCAADTPVAGRGGYEGLVD